MLTTNHPLQCLFAALALTLGLASATPASDWDVSGLTLPLLQAAAGAQNAPPPVPVGCRVPAANGETDFDAFAGLTTFANGFVSHPCQGAEDLAFTAVPITASLELHNPQGLFPHASPRLPVQAQLTLRLAYQPGETWPVKGSAESVSFRFVVDGDLPTLSRLVDYLDKAMRTDKAIAIVGDMKTRGSGTESGALGSTYLIRVRQIDGRSPDQY